MVHRRLLAVARDRRSPGLSGSRASGPADPEVYSPRTRTGRPSRHARSSATRIVASAARLQDHPAPFGCEVAPVVRLGTGRRGCRGPRSNTLGAERRVDGPTPATPRSRCRWSGTGPSSRPPAHDRASRAGRQIAHTPGAGPPVFGPARCAAARRSVGLHVGENPFDRDDHRRVLMIRRCPPVMVVSLRSAWALSRVWALASSAWVALNLLALIRDLNSLRAGSMSRWRTTRPGAAGRRRPAQRCGSPRPPRG